RAGADRRTGRSDRRARSGAWCLMRMRSWPESARGSLTPHVRDRHEFWTMKSARLVSEIVILAARTRPITAADLARRLEVTERTVYPDLADLSAIGVPALTPSGPGGGIGILGDWRSAVAGLNREGVEAG